MTISKMNESLLPQASLKEILSYDVTSGLFFWLKNMTSLVRAGDLAGHSPEDGYITIMIKKKPYKAHRLAWLYVYGEWPNGEIDHINHVRNDNRLDNLRGVSSLANSRNVSKFKNNTSGLCGVSWSKCSSKWHPQIMVEGKRIHLGFFLCFFEAACARKSAENKYGFHVNHGC